MTSPIRRETLAVVVCVAATLLAIAPDYAGAEPLNTAPNNSIRLPSATRAAVNQQANARPIETVRDLDPVQDVYDLLFGCSTRYVEGHAWAGVESGSSGTTVRFDRYWTWCEGNLDGRVVGGPEDYDRNGLCSWNSNWKNLSCYYIGSYSGVGAEFECVSSSCGIGNRHTLTIYIDISAPKPTDYSCRAERSGSSGSGFYWSEDEHSRACTRIG
jgi:hypothetical protein